MSGKDWSLIEGLISPAHEGGRPRSVDMREISNAIFRKRHIVVDTMGLLLYVVVHAASIQDRNGARILLEKLRSIFPTLKVIFADGGYADKLVQWAEQLKAFVLKIVKRTDKGFKILPKRWIVERTF